MSSAQIEVTWAGPHISIQDAGRLGYLRFGVPRSGPMDQLAHATANLAVGNSADATAIEISRGGLTVRACGGSVTAAVAGGGFSVNHQGAETTPWRVFTLRQGEEVSVKAGGWGSWAYLAFAGSVIADTWLGHSATHALARLGGGAISSGQLIEVAGPRATPDRDGEIPIPDFACPDGLARVVMGPQDQHFEPSSVLAFGGSSYRLTDAYDRMGVRLLGPPLILAGALSIPSEPIAKGSIQVAGDGVPTVLLADHQTTGGYPKIATVISADLDRVSQMRPGDEVTFAPVSAVEAIAIAREQATLKTDYLELVAQPIRTLAQRLMHHNLIGHQPHD